jgi:hypothetical protein
VFYHLGELDSALTYALGAGGLFDVNDRSPYVQTLVGGWPMGAPSRCAGPLAGPRLHHPGQSAADLHLRAPPRAAAGLAIGSTALAGSPPS